MIRIKLRVDGKIVDFVSRLITMRVSLDAYKLYARPELAEGIYNDETVEDLCAFICGMFGDQFTPDQLLDGFSGSFLVHAPRFLRQVLATVDDRLQDFPQSSQEEKATKAATS